MIGTPLHRPLRAHLAASRHRFVAAFAVVALAAAALAPATLAADVTDIGYVDQAALSSIPAFTSANRQLATYKAQLDRQFARQVRKVRDQGTQARIAQQFQNQLAQRQRDLFGPLFQRAQVAIASVASSRNLSVVVDKRIVVFGGQDVTGDVEGLLNGPGDPIPPVNSPPPSSVGYVDQAQIDMIPKLKAANDDFVKFQAAQQKDAQQKLRGAKTDGDRQAILKAYQAALADRQKSTIAPLVDQTRSAIADVAKKKGLLLVIDRSNLIYGGTDITSDVTSDLK
ncbi:MAG: OmpH family outer membrane protein [Candidatus Eremiobacteraeota bacterium]|nr:OmpH family outer membrane protein [Candidatus Eremiobacteraeota bacterium]